MMEKAIVNRGLPVSPDTIRTLRGCTGRDADEISEGTDEGSTPRLLRIEDTGVPDQVAALTKDNSRLKAQVKRLKAEVFDVSQKGHLKEIEQLQAEHAARVAQLKQKYKHYIKTQIQANGNTHGSSVQIPQIKRALADSSQSDTIQRLERELHALREQQRLVQEENVNLQQQVASAQATTAELAEAKANIKSVERERGVALARLADTLDALNVSGKREGAHKEQVASLRRELAAAANRSEVLRVEAASAQDMLRIEQERHRILLNAEKGTVAKHVASLQVKDVIMGEMRNTIRDNIIDTDDLRRRVYDAEEAAGSRASNADQRAVPRQHVLREDNTSQLEAEVKRLERENEMLSTSSRVYRARIQALFSEIGPLGLDGSDGLTQEQRTLAGSEGHTNGAAAQGCEQDGLPSGSRSIPPDDGEQVLTHLAQQLELLLREKRSHAAEVGTLQAQLQASYAELAQLKVTASAAVVELQSTVQNLQGQLTLVLQQKQTLQQLHDVQLQLQVQELQQHISEQGQQGPVQAPPPPPPLLPPVPAVSGPAPPQPLLLPPPPQPPAFPRPRTPLPSLPAMSTLSRTSATALPPPQFSTGFHALCEQRRNELLCRISDLEAALTRTKKEWLTSATELSQAKRRLRTAHDDCKSKVKQYAQWYRTCKDGNALRLAQLEARLAVVDAASAPIVFLEFDSWKESAERLLSEYLFARETEWSAQLADLQAQLWEAARTHPVLLRQLQTEKERNAQTKQRVTDLGGQLRRVQLTVSLMLGKMQASHPAECEQLQQEMRRLQPRATSTELDLYVVVSLPALLEKTRASQRTLINEHEMYNGAASAVAVQGNGFAQPASIGPLGASPVVLDLTADSDCDSDAGSDVKGDVDADREGSNDGDSGEGDGGDCDSVLSSDSGTTVDEDDRADSVAASDGAGEELRCVADCSSMPPLAMKGPLLSEVAERERGNGPVVRHGSIAGAPVRYVAVREEGEVEDVLRSAGLEAHEAPVTSDAAYYEVVISDAPCGGARDVAVRQLAESMGLVSDFRSLSSRNGYSVQFIYASAAQQAVREIDGYVLDGYVLSCKPQHRAVDYKPQRSMAADDATDSECIVVPQKPLSVALREDCDDEDRRERRKRRFEELAQAPLLSDPAHQRSGTTKSSHRRCSVDHPSEFRPAQLTLSDPALTRRGGPDSGMFCDICDQHHRTRARFSHNTEDHKDANYGPKAPRTSSGGSSIRKL
jgi:hypothetical protein